MPDTDSTFFERIRDSATEGVEERRREKFRHRLETFTGTSTFWTSGRLTYTDGIKFLTEEARAHWLLDVVSSYIPKTLEQMRDTGLQEHTAVLNTQEEGAVFEMYDANPFPGNQDPYVRQEIPYTDFPLKRIELVIGPRASKPVIESIDEIEGIIASLPTEG